MKFTYLWIDLASVCIPFLFSFHPRIAFFRVWIAFFPAMMITAIFFIAWDALFTSWGVWGFNPDYISGARIFNLPLEEVLFFVCIPYSCMFTYYCFKLFIKRDFLWFYRSSISSTLIIAFTIIAIMNYERLYTFSASLLLAATIFIFRKSDFISRFYFTYLVLLLPFMIVNGILTGLWIPGEVVWYNNEEIIGTRIFTIPLEDVFYGMLLLLWNTAGMEFFLSGKANNES